MEAALSHCDEAISLLAALGAEIDVLIRASNNTYTLKHRMTLLRWTFKIISLLQSKTALKPIQAPDNLPVTPAGDSWSEYRAYVSAILPHSVMEGIGARLSPWAPRNSVRSLEVGYPREAMEYFSFAEFVLRSHGAAFPGLEELSTSEQPAPVTSQGSGYVRHGNYTTTPVPVHLKVFYDELYEACWEGDNASIRELCLPKQVEEGKEPIQITVHTTIANDSSVPLGALIFSCL